MSDSATVASVLMPSSDTFLWSYPYIDPVVVQLGAFAIHWYGLMYLLGFVSAWWLMTRKAKRQAEPFLTQDQISDVIFYAALGTILGGRLGYVLFYNLPAYIADPLAIFRVWEGGMSFHGGLLGVIVATWFFSHRNQKNIFDVADFFAAFAPIGIGAVRLANFINNELWGKVTDSPLGMLVYDPELGQVVAKYPTQLLEAFLEGLVLLVVLLIYGRKPRPRMAMSGLFLLSYGVFRFFVEFYRVPDTQLGYLAWNWLTMGQVLSMPMIVLGALLLFLAYRKPVYASGR